MRPAKRRAKDEKLMESPLTDEADESISFLIAKWITYIQTSYLTVFFFICSLFVVDLENSKSNKCKCERRNHFGSFQWLFLDICVNNKIYWNRRAKLPKMLCFFAFFSPFIAIIIFQRTAVIKSKTPKRTFTSMVFAWDELYLNKIKCIFSKSRFHQISEP